MKMEERDRLIAESGERRGQIKKSVQIVCRMLQNGKTPEEIIDILGEDEKLIMIICNAAESSVPEYDLEKIFASVYAAYMENVDSPE